MTAPAAARERITASDLERAIRARYQPPEWRVESEVTLGGRRLDIVALNLWGARQYRIVGFEIKASRGDWLRELHAFQKSELWTEVVDAFYLVTPPKLVPVDEVPAGWGLLELTASRMMTRRHAPMREGRRTLPRELCARFVSRLMRDLDRQDRAAEYAAREAIRTQETTRAREAVEQEVATDRAELARLRAEHTQLLTALGIRSSEWRALERALRAARVFAEATSDPVALMRRLEASAHELETHARHLRDAVAVLSEPTETMEETR